MPYQIENEKIYQTIDENVKMIKEIFKDDEMLILRRISNLAGDLTCCIAFFDSMISNDIVNNNVVRPIVNFHLTSQQKVSSELVRYSILFSDNVEKANDVSTIITAMLSGDTVLFLENSTEALTISSKGWQTRAVTEPEAEKAMRGPREGFNESLIINLTLVRRKLKTPDLKFRYYNIGEKTNTKSCICYIDGLVDPKVLDEVYKRLDNIKIDGIMDSGTIQELIKDAPRSPFKTVGNTERPDVVAAKLLEGKVAIFVDGSPQVLTVPHIFLELFQTNEDYYINYYFSSINRMIRIVAYLISISVPALYLALITFHQEVIPTPLILSIAAARQGVPFPTIVEELGLLFVFEILRETGTRMPSYIGQALSIVGALVIGQAAVDAKFVSAPIVIIVAIAGITGLILPKMKGSVIFLRIFFIFPTAILGLYGYIFSVSILLFHLFSLRSFGVSYMTSLIKPNLMELRDTIIRAPWWYLKRGSHLLREDGKIKPGGGKQN